MLRASAHSPAMLEYLDNTRSRAARPNENYARELMELHTLGVDGGYTQTDVAELSRAAHRVDDSRAAACSRFDPDAGTTSRRKTVLGDDDPAPASDAGRRRRCRKASACIDMLLAHPEHGASSSRRR